MIKLFVVRKFIAVLANISLLFNSFFPFLFAIQPAYAQSPEGAVPAIVESTPTPESNPEIKESSEVSPANNESPTPEPTNAPEPTKTPEPTNAPEPTNTPEPTKTPEPTSTPIVVSTPNPTEEPTPSPEQELTPTPTVQLDLSPTPINSEIGTLNPTVEASPTPTLPVEVEKECLTDDISIINSTNDLWTINDTDKISETTQKVQLGVKYVFPQDDKVSVVFKCLPKDETLRTTLKIQQVKTSDLKLPENIGKIGEYAYDITTGMNDGDFEYDVTLPKSSDSTAEVSYIEKSIDDATKNEIKVDEIKPIEESKTEQQSDTVKATGIDHFTIFIATYADFGITTTETVYLQGDTVYTKATASDLSKYYRVDILDPSNVVNNIVACQTGVSPLNGLYLLSTTAQVSNNWKAQITQYNSLTDCNNRSSIKDTNTKNFEVKTTNPVSLANPALADSCGLDIAIVIDVSGSIDNTELNQMKSAFTGFVDALDGTPTQFSVTQFDTTASVLQGFTSDFTAVKTKINSAGGGNCTNWDDGIFKANSTFGGRADKPDLILFASDGNPNTIINGQGCGANESTALNAAVGKANIAKTAGRRILTLGIGNQLSVENLKAISGHNVNTGSVLTSDVITTDFSGLAAQLATFAKQTCGGKISVNKYVDGVQKSDGQTWSFKIDGTTTLTTDTNGQVASGTLSVGNHSISEVSIPSGYSFDHAACTSGVADPANPGIKDIAVTADSIITCSFYNTTNKGSITIIKDAVPDNAQNFSFTTTGTGLSNFSLDDDSDATLSNTKVFSNLMPGTYSVSEGAVTSWTQTSATCSDGSPITAISLQPGEDITCTFVNTRQKGTLTVIKNVINDEDGTANADDFNLYVKNGEINVAGSPFSGSETGTIFQLDPGTYAISEDENDVSYFGSISGNCAPNGSITIAAGDNKTCTITNEDKDFLPSVEVTKTASVATVSEPGGKVTYTFTVKNLSSFENAEITSLSDDKFGTLTGDADCKVGTILAAGATCTFQLVDQAISGNAGSTHTNKFTAIVKDDEGNTATDNESETVTFTDVKPDIFVTKDANPTSLPEPGGSITFTVVVTNQGVESVTLNTLSDDIYGNLNGQGTCSIPQTIAPGKTYSCIFTGNVGPTPGVHTDIVTAKAKDDENNEDIAWDDATVNISYVPTLKLVKSVINDNGGTATASQWTLTATGSSKSFSDNGATGTFHIVDPDVAYTLTESGPSGYTPSSWQCNGGNLASNILTLNAEDDVTCTITNTRDTGTLRVLKNVDLNGDGDYTDAGETGATNWHWQVDGGSNHHTGDNAITLSTGIYHLTETNKTDYHPTGLTCTPNGSVDGSDVTITKGTNVVCTFTNARDTGTIIVHKEVRGPNGENITDTSTNFTTRLDGSDSKTLTDNGTVTYSNVITGNHSITEYNPSSNYDYYSITPDANGNKNDGAQINVTSGNTTHVYITNRQKKAEIKVYKDVRSPNGSNVSDNHSFTIQLNGGYDRSLAENDDEEYEVNPGTGYTISEKDDVNYDEKGCKLHDGSPATNLTLTSNQDITVVCTNWQKNATVTVVKNVKAADGTTDVTDNYTFKTKLDGSNEKSFSENSSAVYSVAPGNHSITENSDSNYISVGCSPDSDSHHDGAQFTVGSNDSKTITCINKQKPSSITIVKKSHPDSSTDFEFTRSFGSNFILEDDNNNSDGQPDFKKFENLNSGSYNFNENIEPGWYLDNIVCTGASSYNPVVYHRSLSVTVTPGQNATCTFHNYKKGKIEGEKFYDKNGNNHDDSGEPDLKGWKIFIDGNKNGIFDSGERFDMTNHDGDYSFDNLMPGTYRVCEEMQTGWYPVSGSNCQNTTINNDGGDVDEINFANRQYGSIKVCKVIIDGSGNIVNGSDVSGTTFTIDWDKDLANSVFTAGDTPNSKIFADSESNDAYCVDYTNLYIDSYHYSQETIGGNTSIWEIAKYNDQYENSIDNLSDFYTYGQNNDSNGEINLALDPPGINRTLVLLNQYKYSDVTVVKYNDKNGDGIYDENNEDTLADWTVNLSGKTKVTTVKGAIFDQLLPDTYYLSETMQPGWTQTKIRCDTQTNNEPTSTPTPTPTEIPSSCIPNGNVCYGDLVSNGCCGGYCVNGICSSTRPTPTPTEYPGQCKSEHAECQINNSNKTCCEGLTCVTGDNPSGNGHCESRTPAFNLFKIKQASAQEAPSGHEVVVKAGDHITCYIGNQRLEPKLTIAKFNNVTGNLSPGDSAQYTIDLAIQDNDIKNLKVTDLLSNGFKYRVGSYKILKNGQDVTSQVGEPQYHSPGVWDLSDLGQLTPEDNLELIYLADISTDQQAGKYTDLAWAIANYAYDGDKSVLATAEPEGYVDTNFVGTIVPINRNSQNSVSAEVEQKIEGQVLGASTELPGTGASTLWLILSSILGFIGLGVLKINKKYMLTLLFAVLSFSLITKPVLAADFVLSVQEPKTPSNTKDLKLEFKALHLNNGVVTAKCLKKGPNDSGFSQFGSSIVLTAGGNSSHCDLSLAINDNGSYQFNIEATDGVDTATKTVSLDYNTSTPGTPRDYRKENINSNNCDFKIHFRTDADNGKTVKVELYRSTDSAFSANNESLVHSVNIGSDQEYDILNNVPDCSQTYYYALRAFDSAGNGSGLIGDKITITTTTTTTENLEGQTGQATGAIPVIGDNIPSEDNLDGQNIDNSSTDQSSGQILGSETQSGNIITRHKLAFSLIAIILLAIIIYVFKKIKKAKKKLKFKK